MKKTYSKLKTDRVVVSTESGVMACTTRINTTVTVHDYKVYSDWSDPTRVGSFSEAGDAASSAFTMGFDE